MGGVPRLRAVECSAPRDHVWALISRPERWREWSPHVQGAQGLGTPEVKEGASGALVLRGGLRIPARVTEVTPGESWSWQVAGMHVRHAVRPDAGGSRIELAVEGAAAPWSLVALAYAPVASLIARNIARVAESTSSRRCWTKPRGRCEVV